MKAIVVGMGVQGVKRKKSLKNEFICSVDKFKRSSFQSIQKVPLNIYDTVFVCVPDNEKVKIIKYSLKNKKNVLVEKPFITDKAIIIAKQPTPIPIIEKILVLYPIFFEDE